MHDLVICYSVVGQQVVEARRKTLASLGEEHPDTLLLTYNLAVYYNEKSRRQEALQLTEQVAEAYKRPLGEKHPHILSTIPALANWYSDAGWRQEALQLTEQVWKLGRGPLGKEHPDTLLSMDSLTVWYSVQRGESMAGGAAADRKCGRS